MNELRGFPFSFVPEQVFEKASPSIVIVQALDRTNGVVGFGSGVLIAPGEVITNCHVVEDGLKWLVQREGRRSPAYVRFYDKPRDLCQLHAPLTTSFTRPIRGFVAMDDLRVGQRVYAIGAPRGLELTLTEGIVSALRRFENGAVQLIQTTAAVSPGSSGGGLFDQEGRLIGITTFILKESQSLNFAVPASWVLELPSRQADLIERARRRQAEELATTELWRREEELKKREERLRAAERSAADAAWLEEKKRLDEEADAVAGAGAQRVVPQVRSEPGPRPKYEAKVESNPFSFPDPPLPPRPAEPIVPAVENGAVSMAPTLKRGDEDAALKRFQQDVWRIVGRVVSERDYPRLARDRGWEGITKVRVEIGSDGLLKKVTLTLSSGFSVLDDRAVSKIREIKLPKIPDELRERAFSVDVPFRFSLRKGEQ